MIHKTFDMDAFVKVAPEPVPTNPFVAILQ